MTPIELFRTLHACGVTLTPYPDGTLRYKAPKGVLTPALLAGIRDHKEALLDLVEAFEERAAIAEYCAGLPRVEAEREAWTQMEERWQCKEGPMPKHTETVDVPASIRNMLETITGGPVTIHVEHVIPCAVCGDLDRWDDGGTVRCRRCSPPPSKEA